MTDLQDREGLYNVLAEHLRSTPLTELVRSPFANGCRVFVKEEFRHPTGSIYDRMTLALLRGLELVDKKICPGSDTGQRGRLVETTTGSSGASFAWLCRVLGYEALVFIPESMPRARIEQIRSYGAEVRTTRAGYIQELIQDFQSWYLGENNRRSWYAPNHSQDERFAPAEMEALAGEILTQFQNQHSLAGPDYFIAALGNGTSAVGVGRPLHALGCKIVGMEPYESPTVLRRCFPSLYQRRYEPDFQFSNHKLFGTGPGPNGYQFPNVSAVEQILSDVKTVREQDWRDELVRLADSEFLHVGHSTAASVCAARQLAAELDGPANILVLAYDASWRYLDLP